MRKALFAFAISAVCALSFSSCDEDDTWPVSGITDNQEYVDLGLSVLWATHNVGAEAAQAAGSHFAWGEVSTKDSYVWENYKFGLRNSLTNYVTSEAYGTPDGLTTLSASDDVAQTLWGGGWRIPSEDEWVELFRDCECGWDRINNQDGMRITGKNGNWIFLPVTGHFSESQLSAEMSFAYYWTSVVDGAENDQARAVRLHNFSLDIRSFCRAYGICVRPVHPKL